MDVKYSKVAVEGLILKYGSNAYYYIVLVLFYGHVIVFTSFMLTYVLFILFQVNRVKPLGLKEGNGF